MKKLNQYLLATIFMLILATPIVANYFNIFKSKVADENRNLANKPAFDWKHLDQFPSQFDAYYNDHFSLRGTGVYLYNHFCYFFLKKSPVPDRVIIGKKDWIFEAKDLDIYRGKKRLNETEIQKLSFEFKRRVDFLSKCNCKLMVVLIPTKKNIYSEYLPSGYYKYSNKSITDQFINLLQKEKNIEIVDLREVIRKAKSETPLYHKYDNHWNEVGAYYAYNEIIKRLSKFLPVGNPHPFEDFKVGTKNQDSGNLAKMLGLEGELVDTRYTLTPQFELKAKQLPQKYKSPERFPYPWAYEKIYSIDNESLPRLFMVNDSFGEYLYPYLSEHFSYSIYLFDSWEYNLHPLKIIDEKPDVYVMCILESLIINLLDNLDREENVIPNNIEFAIK
jgi:alginate O-acetyltransferase complex protein AlgJ